MEMSMRNSRLGWPDILLFPRVVLGANTLLYRQIRDAHTGNSLEHRPINFLRFSHQGCLLTVVVVALYKMCFGCMCLHIYFCGVLLYIKMINCTRCRTLFPKHVDACHYSDLFKQLWSLSLYFSLN